MSYSCAWSDLSYDGPRYTGKVRVTVLLTPESMDWLKALRMACDEVTEHDCGCHARLCLDPSYVLLVGSPPMTIFLESPNYIVDLYGVPDHVRPLVNMVMERNMPVRSPA